MAISIDRSFLEQVDLVALIERRSPTRFGKPAGNGTKCTRKGPCPFCGGTDRFAVFVNDEPQRYKCGIHGNGCGAHGDAIDFLRQYEHIKFYEAVAFLNEDIDPSLVRSLKQAAGSGRPQWQSDQWQREVTRFCKDAETRLGDAPGEQVVTYLRGRGFTQETIKKAHLGVSEHKGAIALVIPWIDRKHGYYWRVTFRNVSVHPKWRYDNYYGSSVSEGMYGADSLAFNRPTFLVEGELDALSIAQEAGDLVSVVATGTTTGSHALEWVMELATRSHVFVAFDAEEKAEGSAKYWLDALSNATRIYTPIGKDANEMLRRGLNIRLWIEAILSTLSSSGEPETPKGWYTPALHLLRNDRGLLLYCSQCDKEATWWGPGAMPFCKDHWAQA